MQERGEHIPPEDSLEVARKVKESYCYTCSDIVKVTFCDSLAETNKDPCSVKCKYCFHCAWTMDFMYVTSNGVKKYYMLALRL